MSLVPLKKILKKIFLASFLTLFLGIIFSIAAEADFDIGKLFSTGDQNSISFTQYSGQLAQLDSKGYDSGLVASTDLKSYILKIVNFALGFLGLIAVLIVIYGGVLYVTAAGEDEKVGKAKKAIGYAAVGLLIVMGSFAFVNTIIKGGTNGAETGSGGGATAITASQGFNAAAEEIKSLALEIYKGFMFLSQTTEDFNGIMSDIKKDSLKIDQLTNKLPSKADILAFLKSVGSKLSKMKEGLQPISTAEATINKALRELAVEIDSVNSLNEIVYMFIDSNNSEQVCEYSVELANWKKSAPFMKYMTEPEEKDLCLNVCPNGICNTKNTPFSQHTQKGLYDKWKTLQGKYSNETTYNDWLKPIRDDYALELKRILGRLEEINLAYSNIAAIGDSKSIAGVAYVTLKSKFGYESSNGTIKASISGLLYEVEKWTVKSSLEIIGQFVLEGLKQQSILYEEMKKLQFVQARLTADVIDGASPLTVNFNALATVDPAGGSVQGENIYWDLSGSKTIEQLTKYGTNEAAESVIKGNDSVNCGFDLINKTDDAKKYTTVSCTYNRPGTYTAAIKINSNNKQKYAPGISVLTIKVRPPTTKIELVANTSDTKNKQQVLMHYNKDILLIDEQEIQYTTDQAKNGIYFDATGTSGNNNEYFWNFGDGKDVDSQSQIKTSHKFTKPGKYKITLTVHNATTNTTDHKIFTLEVSSVAAKLKANPPTLGSINSDVIFDASDSSSDVGKITNYKWNIDAENPTAEIKDIYPHAEEGATLKTITHVFKIQGKYKVNVEVQNAAGQTATKTINFEVRSQPPLAQFEFKNSDKTQPGTVYLDGSKSYDPDGKGEKGKETFSYKWEITASGAATSDYKEITKPGYGNDAKFYAVKFKKPGTYEAKLTVTDLVQSKETTSISKTIKIDNVLDIAWDSEQKATASLDEKGKAEVKFLLTNDSGTAKTYEINFGDGETGNGNFGDKITHSYGKSGKFVAKVTVFDEGDHENNIEKKIFIAGNDQTIAKARFSINGEEIQDLSQGVKVSKQDVLTFDAMDSKNSDGSGNNLKFSWDFGDGKNSSKLKATHTYKELSPKDPGYFKVKLSVYDAKDPDKDAATDEFDVQVVNVPPAFSSISAVPQPVNNTLTTPVTAVLKVYGAEDSDGQIVKYKWWYFDPKDPEKQYGVQITTGPTAKIIIGTRGKEGDEITYGFGLEITDSDGLTYSNEEAIQSNQYAKLTVTNGANGLPTAKFNVNNTSIFAGDKVTFTSSSTDPDGHIAQYIWDFDGDGFFNDEPTDQSSIEHSYTKINKVGYDVRLKVIDDKGGEAISEPIKVHVDSLAKPPTAGFTFTSIPGSDGMKIKFTNTSTVDTKAGAEVLSYQWDFDTESKLAHADSNGDGKKDNDTDSQAKDPERLYSEADSYRVKLIITDSQGNKDEVVNAVNLPLANPPKGAFTYTVKDGQVLFANNSKSDVGSGSTITKNIWDFDTATDSDGDGKKDNDNDSQLKDPSYAYSKPGKYQVKLTTIDNQGGIGSVTNDVTFNADTSQPVNNGLPANGSTSTNNGQLKAAFTTDPLPAADGIVYLSGTNGSIKFDFSKSAGAIQYFIIDKNIYFDTDGDGDKTNDQDFKTALPGTWNTNFDKAWGQIVVKLTVTDIYGNKSNATQEVKFQP